MGEKTGWEQIEMEARQAFVGEGRFPLPAYSELMPPPWVAFKPYGGTSDTHFDAATGSVLVTEYEWQEELAPGLERIAARVAAALRNLLSGSPHELSRTLLDANPAWSPELAQAAQDGRLADPSIVLALSVALSLTQDDKGNVRWTLFGVSHHGAAAPFWRSFDARDADRFALVVRLMTGSAGSPLTDLNGLRVLAAPAEVPGSLLPLLRPLLLDDSEAVPAGVSTVLTFRPWARLSASVRAAYLDGRVCLVPTPASLVFHEHLRYRELAATLPRATQIPLLHLFPRVEGSCALRIPQSGWLDEVDPAQPHAAHGHRVVRRFVRTHRWQRTARDRQVEGDGCFTDPVSVVLFSTNPDDLGLYGKPMARNAQVWDEEYRLLLDGPRATALEVERAARAVDAGGRFGYRFIFPPMRVGRRELFWHLPLIARSDPRTDKLVVMTGDAPLGYVSAEPLPEDASLAPILLPPHLMSRPEHRAAALLAQSPDRHLSRAARDDVRRLLEFRDGLGAPLDPELADALRRGRNVDVEGWRLRMAELTREHNAAPSPSSMELIGAALPAGAPVTLGCCACRDFETKLWRTIAELCESDLRMTNNADPVLINDGKTGGVAVPHGELRLAARRDLGRVGDLLHARHRDAIARHGMEGQARVVDHSFRWHTEVQMPWSQSWTNNQLRAADERNVVLMIPGRERDSAVIMTAHYDTAYMEDVFERANGGDGLRAAAAGADDNGSGTAALLMAADVLLPLARERRLRRDVWLVHLTGEEFPSDCLGARALARALVERNLRFTAEDDSIVDVSRVRIAGTFVLDMIGHNNPRSQDVFQIAPGEGQASARLGRTVHLANRRWNAIAAELNGRPDRSGKSRAARVSHGHELPPPFAHLPLRGEIRSEWEPSSALYNTDGQIFSDVGVPVVLLMEDYDISRSGYHDMHDTMKNIDLDYAAALSAIAIEAVAMAAVE